MNNCSTNHLYIMSFVAGADSGLAFLSAKSPDEAMSLLRNTGRYNGTPDTYKAIQIRDIGMSSTIRSELLMESYVNALVAYDAISNVIRPYIGPVGPRGKSNYELAVETGYTGSLEEWIAEQKGVKGDKGDAAGFGVVDAVIGDNIGEPSVAVTTSGPDTKKDIHFAFDGIRGVSIKSIAQTTTSLEPEGTNVVKVTLEDDREFSFQVKNGPAGIQDVEASVDGLPGTPRCVASIEDGLLTLSFYGLKGAQGDPGVSNTRIVITEDIESETASADTLDIVFWQYNESTGEYDRYITQYDGSEYNFVQYGDTSLDLDDYQRKDDEVWLTQEEFDALPIKDITKTYNVYEEDDSIVAGDIDGDSGSSDGSDDSSGSGDSGTDEESA